MIDKQDLLMKAREIVDRAQQLSAYAAVTEIPAIHLINMLSAFLAADEVIKAAEHRILVPDSAVAADTLYELRIKYHTLIGGPKP